jgi:hypothetical protein
MMMESGEKTLIRVMCIKRREAFCAEERRNSYNRSKQNHGPSSNVDKVKETPKQKTADSKQQTADSSHLTSDSRQ